MNHSLCLLQIINLPKINIKMFLQAPNLNKINFKIKFRLVYTTIIKMKIILNNYNMNLQVKN